MRGVAVVTGAGRGIGREIARLLAGRGMLVVCTDVDEVAASRTAEACGGGAIAVAHDVREPDHHRQVAARATELGTLVAWFNNAGVLRVGKAWQHDDDELRLLVQTNVLGVMFGSRTAIESMGPEGGHVVNMASMSSFGPVPGLAVYGATKHAVHGYTMSLQGDLREAGLPIRVHALCPDGVATAMVEERSGEEDSAIIWSGGRLLEAEDVARRAVRLIDGDRVVVAVPRHRSALARSLAPFPRLALRLLPLFRRAGERNRRASTGRAQRA